MSAQEAVTGGYNPGNMNTGTYCAVLSVELQNEIPEDRGPPFLWTLALPFLALRCVNSGVLFHPASKWTFHRYSSDCVSLSFRNQQGLPLVYRVELTRIQVCFTILSLTCPLLVFPPIALASLLGPTFQPGGTTVFPTPAFPPFSVRAFPFFPSWKALNSIFACHHSSHDFRALVKWDLLLWYLSPH